MTHTTLLVAAALALAVHGHASAQSSPPSLNDARKAVRDGTSEGIVILPARKPSAPSAPSDAAVPSAPVGAAAGAPAPKAATGSFLEELRSKLPPPSGRSLQSARRLDAPDVGIPLPTQSASAPARRP